MAVMRKYERDIDIMLAEEFNVCPAFADWFLSKSRFSPRSGRVEEVFVSKSDNNGESDLIVVYKLENNNRVALLFEDKVDASIQPNQAERYKKRAEAEVSDGAFAEYDLFLCAPRAYCAAKPESS